MSTDLLFFWWPTAKPVSRTISAPFLGKSSWKELHKLVGLPYHQQWANWNSRNVLTHSCCWCSCRHCLLWHTWKENDCFACCCFWMSFGGNCLSDPTWRQPHVQGNIMNFASLIVLRSTNNTHKMPFTLQSNVQQQLKFWKFCLNLITTMISLAKIKVHQQQDAMLVSHTKNEKRAQSNDRTTI